MTRLLTEGFEMGDMYGMNIIANASTTQKRTGSYSVLAGTSYNSPYHILISAADEIYVRAGIHIASLNYNFCLYFYDGITVIAKVQKETADGVFHCYIGAGEVAVGTFTQAINTWYLLEVHLLIDGANGKFETRVDGVPDINFTGDTLATSATMTKIVFTSSGAGQPIYVDDIAINDTAGVTDNSWCGDGHIVKMKPNANGDSSDLNGSDGDKVNNYLLVDDIPNDGDTTYVSGSVVDDYDLYNTETFTIPTDASVTRVWSECRAKDPATGDIALMIKTEATEYDSSTKSLTTSYSAVKGTEYLLNPNTAAAWTQAQLDALQVGVKIKS